MVSILIVSHSREIADGTKKLAEQMKQKDVEIKAVGGTAEGEIGTDPDAINTALEEINKEDGVIILADLGSAIMSVNMVMDWLDEDIKKRVVLADAPIVEGAVFAAVEAGLGNSISDILSSIESLDIIKKN
ncbi:MULTISPECIES: dihydroxyacetone kinase phosphoryl donor subunit DhaM [unclassified Halanaerobium]|uniref:dihydroxyacetone kinase phosphoryl donor subunit DhaM n=1 Tax=unclassified Halanaerobium TaxID=2641197 RepID=UPI000DF3D950|nr:MULTISPECIES: dihydroxyacetone kinase phosphoryl donor subunit DhaM [unclassified Halanaerobium]RCW51364.1 dihydroxyacetone kinase DhaM subunit [Halanaerobium sp. MA284_MarDTE_T2]RCW81437.1 dihydroxyacetone kinase DhaM subunit [Halanaerobium sp. DL-01]